MRTTMNASPSGVSPPWYRSQDFHWRERTQPALRLPIGTCEGTSASANLQPLPRPQFLRFPPSATVEPAHELVPDQWPSTLVMS